MWVVCKLVWVSETCQLFLVPSWNSNTPLYPSKCCELGSVPRLLHLPLSCTWTHFWILQGVGSASKLVLALAMASLIMCSYYKIECSVCVLVRTLILQSSNFDWSFKGLGKLVLRLGSLENDIKVGNVINMWDLLVLSIFMQSYKVYAYG